MQCLIRHQIQHAAYDRAVTQLLNGERLTHENVHLFVLYAFIFEHDVEV